MNELDRRLGNLERQARAVVAAARLAQREARLRAFRDSPTYQAWAAALDELPPALSGAILSGAMTQPTASAIFKGAVRREPGEPYERHAMRMLLAAFVLAHAKALGVDVGSDGYPRGLPHELSINVFEDRPEPAVAGRRLRTLQAYKKSTTPAMRLAQGKAVRASYEKRGFTAAQIRADLFTFGRED